MNPIAEPPRAFRSIRHQRQVVQNGIDCLDEPDVLIP
jgi:hypothetical protein